MAKSSKIHQFIPESKAIKIHGAYGWGVDIGETKEYRVVMYAPVEHDEEIVGRSTVDRWIGQVSRVHRTVRPHDHGPAHVHVIHKKTGHETKFELIEAIEKEDCYGLPIKQKVKNKEPIWPQNIKNIKECLKPFVPEFIQLWQQLYCDTPLRQCVSRISEKDPRCIERVYYNKDRVYVTLTNIRDNSVEKIDFNDYKERPPR